MDNYRIFKYDIIKNDLLNDIKSGKFLPGDKIYSENELKEMYEVSSTTVVKALNELVSEGYVVRRQGEGTFVRRNVQQRNVLYSEDILLTNRGDKLAEKNYTTISEPFIDETISKKMGHPTEEVVLITQVGVIDDQIWKIHNRFFLASRLDETSRENILSDGSVSKELGYRENMVNFPTKIKMGAGRFEDAMIVIKKNMANFARDCEMDTNKPLLILRRFITDLNGVPVEYAINYIDSDFLDINIEST